MKSLKEEGLKLHFNPRSREGSDTHRPIILISAKRFQSTLPRGERLSFSQRFTQSLTFQSTLPRGERHPTEVRLKK